MFCPCFHLFQNVCFYCRTSVNLVGPAMPPFSFADGRQPFRLQKGLQALQGPRSWQKYKHRNVDLLFAAIILAGRKNLPKGGPQPIFFGKKPCFIAIFVTQFSCPSPISRKIFPLDFIMFISFGKIELYASRPSFPPFNATNGSKFCTSFFKVFYCRRNTFH